MRKRECFTALACVLVAVATSRGAWRAGLVGGKTSGAFNVADYPAETDVYLCPHAATNNDTTASGVWYDCVNTTWVYTGQVYLAGATTFAENIDDSVLLLVGGTQILNNSVWNTPTYGTFTPEAPGWHSFELRMGNGSGGAGPVAGNGWTATKGFGMASGTNTSTQGGDYEIPIDPGDISLFRYDDGLGFDDSFTIAGVPANIGEPDPDYGTYGEVANGSNLTMSVASGSGYVEVSDTQRACCTGYVWYAVDVDTSTKTVVQGGTETSFAYSHSNMAEIVWLWKVENLVTVAANAGGTVSTNGGWGDCVAETLMITATPLDGYEFYRWDGDVDVTQSRSAQITVDFSQARTLRAIFLESVAGTVFYLSPGGNNTNDGTSWAKAFLTLSNAVEKATDGSTIRVEAGDYPIARTVTIFKNLQILSVSGAELTRFYAADSQYTLVVLDNADALIDGVTISGASSGNYLDGGNLKITASGGTIRNSILTGAYTKAVHNYGMGAALLGGLMDRCLVIGNTNTLGSAYGIVYLKGGTMRNTILARNYVNYGAIFVYGDTATASNPIRVQNCTVANNDGCYGANNVGIYIAKQSQQTYVDNIRIENSIFCHNRAHLAIPSASFPEWLIDSGSIKATTNIFYNCVMPYAPNPTCITNSPDFASVANLDFSLLPASSCIDTGVANGLGHDYKGAARPSGAKIDIGAIEFDQSEFTCGLTASALRAPNGGGTTLTAAVHGGTYEVGDTLEYSWLLVDQAGNRVIGSGATFTTSLPTGIYTATLVVTNTTANPHLTASATKTNYILRSPPTMYVAAGNTGAAFPYASISTAAAKLQTALDVAYDGTTIYLEPGVHDLGYQAVIRYGIAINGDGDGAVVRQTYDGERVFYMNHPDARIENIAVTGGRVVSTTSPTGVHYANDEIGCGVKVDARGGTVYNCIITNNGNKTGSYYKHGGGLGMNAGLASRCIISNNFVVTGTSHGGGAYLAGTAMLENSLVFGNRCMSNGGGIDIVSSVATARNCTVYGNYSSSSTAGGIYWTAGTVQNCAVYGNTSAGIANIGPAAARTSASIRNCATAEGDGMDPVLCQDPQFKNAAGGDFRLKFGSDLIDNGYVYAGAGAALDLAGNTRVAEDGIDIGCYEYVVTAPICGITIKPKTEFLAGESVNLTASVAGIADTNGLSYHWTVSDTDDTMSEADGREASLAPSAGTYDVVVIVYRGTTAIVSNSIENALHVVSPTLYADANNAAGARYPWDTPQRAHTNVNELLVESIDGTTIHLAAGTYTLTDVLDIRKNVAIVGDSGRDATFLTSKSQGYRFLYINNADAVVQGVTLTNCLHKTDQRQGGTVYIGPYGGSLLDCRITCSTNTIIFLEGMVYAAAGLIDRCVFDHNKVAKYPNYMNYTFVTLGGSATMRNTLIYDNEVEWGDNGVVYLVSGSVLQNCTIYNNKMRNGSGIYTPVNNLARIENNISWSNTWIRTDVTTETGVLNQNYALGTSTATTKTKNNCIPIAVGTDCVTGDPRLKNAAAGKLGLLGTSPCRNTGLNDSSWMTAGKDCAGIARLVESRVDIGAFECPASGTMFLFR